MSRKYEKQLIKEILFMFLINTRTIQFLVLYRTHWGNSYTSTVLTSGNPN